MGDDSIAHALQSFDRSYPQASGESPLQQLQIQLANAVPYDLEDTEPGEYKSLDPRWLAGTRSRPLAPTLPPAFLSVADEAGRRLARRLARRRRHPVSMAKSGQPPSPPRPAGPTMATGSRTTPAPG